MSLATTTTASIRRLETRGLELVAAAIEAVAFAAFVVLAMVLLVADALSPSTIGVPRRVLAQAATHPNVFAILHGMDLVYLVLGFALLPMLASLILALSAHAPPAAGLALLLATSASGLFIAAGTLDLVVPSSVPELAASLGLSNLAAAAYGAAVLVLSTLGGWVGTLPRPLALLGLAWGVVALLFWPLPLIGAVGPLLGVVWCLWLAGTKRVDARRT